MGAQELPTPERSAHTERQTAQGVARSGRLCPVMWSSGHCVTLSMNGEDRGWTIRGALAGNGEPRNRPKDVQCLLARGQC